MPLSVDPVTFATFVPAALALNLTPGADMMMCLGQGIRGGPRAAIAASAGVSCGAMVNVALAGLGLGAVIVSLPGLFGAIKIAGVLYLLWLAWKTWTTSMGRPDLPAVRPARAFRDGFVVNISNPKVILFILAFLPQFVVPGRGHVLTQFLVLGSVIALGGFVVNGLVGSFAARVRRGLAQDPRFDLWLRRAAATVFGALAVKLALEVRT